MRVPWKNILVVSLITLLGCMFALSSARGQTVTYMDATFKVMAGDTLSFAIQDGESIKIVSGVLAKRAQILDERGRDMRRLSRSEAGPLTLEGDWKVFMRYDTSGDGEYYPVIVKMQKMREKR